MVMVQLVLGVLLQERGRGGCRRRKHMDSALLWEIRTLRYNQKTNA